MSKAADDLYQNFVAAYPEIGASERLQVTAMNIFDEAVAKHFEPAAALDFAGRMVREGLADGRIVRVTAEEEQREEMAQRSAVVYEIAEARHRRLEGRDAVGHVPWDAERAARSDAVEEIARSRGQR